MSATARNLQTLKAQRDTTQSAIASVAGASVGAVSKWFSGEKEPRRKYLDAIASYYLVSIDDLTSERHGLYAQAHGLTDAPDGAIAPNPEPRSAHAPMLGRVHAGDAQEPDVLDGAVPIPFEVRERHPRGYFLEVEGGCMSRVYPEGCLVYVDPDKQPQNGSVVVVRIDGADFVMRRMYRGSSSMMLVADSYEGGYDDIIVTEGHEVELVGTVVWFQPRKELG